MKKRIAIISAAFMMAVGFQQAHAQQQIDLGESTLSEMDSTRWIVREAYSLMRV